MSTNIHIASNTPAKSKAQEERKRKELEARKKLEEQADKERKANTYEDGNNIVWVVNKETEAEYNRKKAKEKAAAKAASATKAGTNTYSKGGSTTGKNGTTAGKNGTTAEKKPEKELSEKEFINKYLAEKFNQSLYYDEAQNARGNLNKAAEKKNYAAAVAKFREEAKKAFIARANGDIPDTAEATLKKSAEKAQKASSLQELRTLYANENKQAREEAARKEMLIKQQTEKRVAEAQRKAVTSALEKARLSKASGGSSAEEFRQNRSEAMGKAAAGSAEGIKKIKDADLKKDIALEFQKIKYQWEEAGRRYDALSEEEKRALYRRHNSSALDRAGMTAEEGGLRSRTAQEARTALGQQIADRYYKLDEESRKLENASEYAFLNRMRSAAGAGVENLGLWLYDTFGYEPGKKVYDKGEARKIGEVTDKQVQLLADAAPSQLGKDLVKVSDSVAQQLSYKILTAPISIFGGSVVFDKAVSKGLSAAEAAKTAGKFSGGVYTGGMALSSAADKYVQCRSEGQGKLEASVRALGTGAISYFTESLGGIGGSKSPLNGLEEKYAESIIGSILYNALEEGGEEFLEYSADILLDGAVDLAARGEWQQEWDWAEVIENAKIGAMTGGLFGGYQKLGDIKEAVDRKIDAKKAAKLEKVAREYSDYMKNAYRLMSDPNLREIAERQIGDTTIPAAIRMNRSETGEMNFGDVLPKKAGTVSFEQMYGTKPPDGTENQSFEEWAAGKDAEKKKAAEEAANAVEQSYEDFKKNLPAEGEKKPIKVSPYTTIKSPYEGESPNKKADTKGERVEIPAESFEEGKRIYETRQKGAGQPGIVSEVKKALTNILNSIGGQHAVVSNNTEFGRKPYEVMVNMNVAGKLAGDPNPSAEKFAVLKNIDSIIENAAYMGSGDYVRHGTKNKNVTRYDYFETEVNINGKPYVVAFDVEVVPGKNNYRTHKVLNEINLMETSTGETRPRRVAEDATPGLQGTNSALSVASSPRLDAQGTESSSLGDVPSPNNSITDTSENFKSKSENSAAKAQQAETEEEARLRTLYESEPEGAEDAAKTSREAPGTVSFEQMYGTKPPDGTENQSFEEWAAGKDAEKKKAAEKKATLAEKQKNSDNSNLTNREKYSLSEQEVTEIKKGVSVITDADNNTIIDIKSNILEDIPKEDWLKRVKNVIRSVFPKGFNLNGEHIDVSAKSRGEFVKSKDSVYLRDKSPEIYRDKMETAPHLDVISQNTEFQNVPPDHARTDNIVSFDKGRVNLKIGGNDYSAEVVIGVKDDGNKVFYDIVGMDANKRRPPSGSQSAQTANTRAQEPSDNISSNDSITDTSENFKSKSENSTAKVQQAETEEEARLRTLYESEPTGKYAGTEAGESKAELDEKVKEAKENAVGDDELKEKPKTEKQKILKRRIEKAGLDMTVEEIMGFAQGLGRIKGFFGSERKDFARIFDDVSEGSRTIRNDLHKLLEVPHRQAQAQYTESYKNAVKAISDKFAKLGIKAGSKESAAVQRIGEHAYQIDSKGNTAEYTYEMLKRDFPDSWEKIAEAAKFTRNIYDDYLKKLNAMYESIYPQTVEKAEERRSKLNAEAQRMSDYKDSLNEVKKVLRENVDKKKAALAKSKDGTQKKADLKRQIATLEARMKAVDSKMAAADSRAFAAKLKSELIKSQIENGEILKNKQIKPRQDYFRHFQELNSNFAELTDIFTNDQNISPGLIGVSAETKPRTMWSSIAQARAKTHAYTEDAVGGLLKYTQTAETLLAYNPLISRYRDISAAIRTAAVMADEKVSGTGTNASRFAAYLDDWTNNIAGKSYVLDRYFERAGTNGRAILKAFEKINGIVKKGSLLHNVMSSAKQISNLPYASAYIPNPKDWISGAIASAESQFGKTETANALREARSQSSFMNERYLDNSIDKLTRAIMNDGIKEKNERFGAAMLGALDRVAAEYIWNTAYGYYLKNPGKADEKMGRDYDSAIDYADDITRRTVAGRGRGETALVQTSKLMGLVAPFQVEVNNTANLMAEQLGKRNAAGLIAVEINVYLMNSLLEAVLGDRPIGFDYISVVEDVLREAFGGGDDDDDEKKKPEAIDIAKNFAAKFAGETLSSLPMGAQIAQIITAGNEKLAQKLFSEDRDPTRYGTGNIGVSGAVKAGQFVWDLFGGKYSVGSNEEHWRMALDAADAIAPIVSPFGIGGRQLARTLRGAHSMAEGGVYGYDSDGNKYLKYLQGNSPEDWAKAILLGQYATDAGREYVDGGFKRLSVSDTEKMDAAFEMKVPKEKFYNAVMGMKQFGNKKDKQNYLFNNEELSADEKRIIDALYFGDKGKEAAAAARKDADMIGAKTNKNNFYDFLSGRLSSDRNYSNEDEFINSGYSGKIRGQIREAGEAHITREQLFEVISGTKGMKSGEKMKYIYSKDGFSPKQKDALADIILGDNGKSRRESYAAANISIEDRALVEEILSDYGKEKKASGSAEQDELNTRKYVIAKLMAQGKSEAEAYRLYKVQNGNWINSRYDLDEKEKAASAKAIKQYGLSMDEYITIKNYSDMGQGEKDEYGNTISGSKKADAIKEIAGILGCGEEAARQKYAVVYECVYDVEELSSSSRNKLKTAKEKYGWTDEKWLLAANAIKLSGATKKKEKIKALRDAGFSAMEAAGYYNLSDGNDYYSSKAAGTPYGLSSGQYDKTKYWSEKSGKNEKEVAGYFKAIKGLTKKVDIIAALEAAGMSSSEANAFWNLRQGYDKEYKAYKNGE